MAFDPSSPAQTNPGLTDVDQIRTNVNHLRDFEASAVEPSNLVGGMFWLYTPATGDKILRWRNYANTAWLDVMLFDATGMPKAHIASNITALNMVHGIQQGSGNGLDADTVDGYEASDIWAKSKGAYHTRIGTDVFHTDDALKTVTASTMTLAKTIHLYSVPESTLRITFYSYAQNAGKAQIYRNSTPVGTLHSVGSSWAWYQEDISGWSDGDNINLYMRRLAAHTSIAAQYFRILYKAKVTSTLV